MTQKTLRLFEALELRGEYIARIETIKNCLNGSESSHRGLGMWREDRTKRRHSPDFDPVEERKQIRALEFKQRKLNSAIQKANYETSVSFDGDDINLLEALELRKGLNRRLGELKTQLVDAAYQTVIYKEGRDIVESSDTPYAETRAELESARRSFRELNRKIRWAAFETQVDYQDE